MLVKKKDFRSSAIKGAEEGESVKNWNYVVGESVELGEGTGRCGTTTPRDGDNE